MASNGDALPKFRNPGSADALGLDQIEDGVAFVTIQDARIVGRGVFRSEAYYSETEERWQADAEASVDKKVIPWVVSLHEAGVTPDGSGEVWAPAVTMLDIREHCGDGIRP